MRLVFSNEEFRIGRISFVGFPLIFDSEGQLIEPVFSFFVDRLLDAGGVQSRKSWPTYGYALLHYHRFLERTGRAWNEKQIVGVPSIVASYRDWSIKGGISRGTTRDRVDLVCGFYEYAVKHGFIADPPFSYSVAARPVRGQHMPGRKTTDKPVPGVKVKVPKRLLKVLSVSEVKAFLGALTNRTHNIMARLQVETGIRVEELVSFPLHYILDPRTRPDARHFFAVRLNPAEMDTKGSVERIIHLPRKLMAELWAYAALERNKRSASGNMPTLFVTEEGAQFATRSVWEIYARTRRVTGFHVNPHALRHTYATHTLAALSKVRNQGSALLYIRNRLGHSSVVTTSKYCHYVDDIAESLMAVYQSELFAALDEMQG